MEKALRTVGLSMTKTMALRRLWMTVGWFGKNIAAVGIGMGISDLQNTFAWLIIFCPLFAIASGLEQLSTFGLSRDRGRLIESGIASMLEQAITVFLTAMAASAFAVVDRPELWAALSIAGLVGVGLFAFLLWNDGPIGAVIHEADKSG